MLFKTTLLMQAQGIKKKIAARTFFFTINKALCQPLNRVKTLTVTSYLSNGHPKEKYQERWLRKMNLHPPPLT